MARASERQIKTAAHAYKNVVRAADVPMAVANIDGYLRARKHREKIVGMMDKNRAKRGLPVAGGGGWG